MAVSKQVKIRNAFLAIHIKIDTVRFQTSIEKENLLCYDKDRPKRKEIEGK